MIAENIKMSFTRLNLTPIYLKWESTMCKVYDIINLRVTDIPFILKCENV